MPVVGTAGHVDHGKSTLIQKITGRNPDRWQEERDRGLTIDLGFAWTRLPGGKEVSFVDVPGHERFLKNMLAGIEAIDVALFVVAADEGWMPQSEEHLAVLDLLDVDRGVVAVTKVDLVDADLRELAIGEVVSQLEGTSLEKSEIVGVSALTGEGLDQLLEIIEGLIEDSSDLGRPRLWVDRSFAVPGAGTVVTGTLLDGSLAIDDLVTILPAGSDARVRSIQSHEETRESVAPGRRVALNLGGVDHKDITRGDMVARRGQWLVSDRFLATLRQARFIDDIEQRGAYQVHMGSVAVGAILTGIEDGRAILEIEKALPMAVGDRFILRDTGRRLVVGGGRVLDPSPGATRTALRQSSQLMDATSPDEVATALLRIRGADSLERLAAHSRGGIPDAALVTSDTALSAERLGRVMVAAGEMVDEAHQRHPLRNGLALATLAGRLGLNSELVEQIIAGDDSLVRVGPDIARPGHSPELSPDQETAWLAARSLLASDLAVPNESDLGIDPDVLGLKLRTGELIRISPDLVYLADQIDRVREILGELGGDFTVADFRDAAGLSRKYAVPILEWSDREGLTVRSGDLRRLR